MTKLDISLPDDVKALADKHAKGGGYASLSDYLTDLIRRDEQERVELELHEQLLVHRLQSPATAMSDGDFDSIRARLEDEIAKRRAS
jgi:antitoxin ParD1/3/4